MSNKYTVEYFIKKFEKIPAKKWCVGKYARGDKFCALGHCGADWAASTEESVHLESLIFIDPFVSISRINDGRGNFAKLGKTPRTRVLKYLRGLLKT